MIKTEIWNLIPWEPLLYLEAFYTFYIALWTSLGEEFPNINKLRNLFYVYFSVLCEDRSWPMKNVDDCVPDSNAQVEKLRKVCFREGGALLWYWMVGWCRSLKKVFDGSIFGWKFHFRICLVKRSHMKNHLH